MSEYTVQNKKQLVALVDRIDLTEDNVIYIKKCKMTIPKADPEEALRREVQRRRDSLLKRFSKAPAGAFK